MSFTDNFLKELEKKKLDNNGGKSPHSGGGKTSQPSKVSSVDDFTDSFLSELGKALEREKKRQQLRNDNDIAPFVSDGSSKKEKDDIEYEITLGRDKNGNLIKHSDLINYEELPFIDKMRIAKKKEEAAKKKQEEAKEKKTSKSEKRTWFKSGAFADGYNFGDVAKSILGTTGDLVEEVLEGIIEIPETVIDAGAYLVGGAGKLFGADDFANKTQKFIAKDLYDAEAFIKENNKNTIGTNLLSWGGTDIEEASLLGDKSEGLANSAGQLVATTALQAVGVPWFVTSGVTSFGGEVENAFQQGASYEEAGISAAITAGAEILTEKLFGGSGLGEKGLINTEVFTKAISNKGLKVLADFGIDVLSEGGEEVASQFFSTLGQQLTYEKEETWAEILSDEEKAEAYLYQVFNSLFGKEAREAYGDAFVGGMALSGGMNAGKVTSSLKNGTDYRTGLTANEEAVVSKETENRIAEAEKDGKKLTNKEKAVIRDQALKALKKGDISTDVIEEVLGGDTYKSYQDTVKNEDTLRKEYDELADIKKSELTAKQEKRLNELEAKLEELKTTSERDFLQKQYKNEAYELAKGTKLEESYRERTRKAQKYDADTSQYKGIAKESIQSIIDKGQINNTNKAHELIDFAVNSAAARGKKVTTTTTAEILAKAEQKHGKDYVRDYFFKQVTDENGNKKLTLSKIPNAEIDGDTIALNVNSPNLTQVVIGHEIGHTFEGTKYYGELAELLNSYDESVKGEEAYTARKNATDTKYQNIAGANSRYELNADLLGEYIFSDEGFVRHLVQNEKVFTGILGRIKYMLKYATSGSQQERDLLRIKRTFEKAWRDAKTANKTGGKTKSAYSLVDVEAVDKYSPKQYNDFGWARYAEAISKNELDDLYSKIQEKGSLKKFMQSGYGEAIIEVNDDPHSTLGVDNVFVFVTGTKNNPVINKVVRFDIETETEMEVIKEQLYERRTFSYTYYSFLREKGLAREYRKKSAVNYIGYRQEVRERSGRGDSNGTYGNGGFERDGRGTLGKTSSDEIAPFEKASSEDGVFFDGKSHFSLANAVDAPVGQGTPLKDLRVNALPDDFAPIAETPNSQTSVDSENGDVNRVDVSSKEYISFEDFANTDSSIWRNVEYDDTATKSAIMQEVHDAMVKDGSVIQVSENITSRVEESFPDLRGMKKKERTPILKEAINKLKSNLRQFLNGFKNQTFEFEVDGKVLEAKLYNTGINEVLEKITQDKASMLYTTEEIFGNARYLYSTPDYDGDPNVYRWNYFYTPVQIGSETVGVRIAVRDVSKGTHNHAPESQIYNWNIKKDASLDGESHDPRAASFGVSSDASIDASLGGERDDSNNRYPSSASSDVSNNIIAPESDVVKSSEETQANVNSDGENKFPSVRELYEQKLSNHKNALAALESNKSNSLSSFDEAIRKKLVEYNGLKDKNTKRANTLLQQIDNLRLRRDNVQADYANKIAKQQARIEAFVNKSFEEFEKDISEGGNVNRVDTEGATALSTEKAVLTESEQQEGEIVTEFITAVSQMIDSSKKSKRKRRVGYVSKNHSSAVNKLMQTINPEFSADGYELWIDGTSADHIERRHGKYGKADNSMASDESKMLIPWAAQNAENSSFIRDNAGNIKLSDRFYNSDGSRAPEIRLEKVINGDIVYVSECVPDSTNKRIWITSAYIKRGSKGQLLNMEETSPQPTPEAFFDSNATNNIIAPESDVVKSSEETQANVNSDGENKFPSVRELYEQKLSNHKNALAALESNKSNSLSSFDEAIRKKLVEYNGLKDKNTKRANTLLQQIDNLRLRRDNVQADYANRIAKQQARIEAFESKSFEEFENETLATRRSELQGKTVESIKDRFNENGLDFDEVLKHAKDLSTFSTVDNTPQRVMEKSLGYKEGGILADLTVNKVAQNETEGIKWLNGITDRKNGLLAQLVKEYGIKPGSKASAAAQMYAEGFYVDKNGDIIEYGDAELEADFPDSRVRENIKKLAKDERVRQFYDETLDAINESRRRNGYPEIQKLDNYFLHFRAMEDTFSRLGLPFNPNDIRAKDLPTDLNGVTADLKPGQPYFASSKHREGKRTSFDLLGGLEKYATSAKNQIYHIDDIQTLRALRNYIADAYGQAKGLENLDTLTEEEAQEKIKAVYNSHLSTFAKFLNEEANVLAGKTALIDRSLEGVIGRRAVSFMDSVNRQVGNNMIGYNVSSALTNLIAPVQAFAKTNKADFIKGFAQTVSNRIKAIKGNGDTFAEESPVCVRRKGTDRFHRTAWQKVSDPGYALMSAVDNFSTEIIARAKYNELTRKGMDSETAHIETDKWVSRLMGDRSLGQMPQIYNSKMLGLVTKFQLEVRNQLDSQFYDTIQEAKASTEDIENTLERNAKKAAKIGSTFFTLAVGQHLFGKAFEAVAGYNPAFDIISVLIKALGLDDDEDSEDTVLDNIEQGFFELMGDMPYTSILEGGRIPISSALPIEELYKGEDQYGNDKSRWETVLEALPYYALPGGYGQFKKTKQGLSMFDEDLLVSGSYTDSGKLRFPVDDNLWKKVQAGLFGQYASENARDYFDNERKPLDEKQIQEFVNSGISIQDYWKYREGLSGLKTLAEKADYIYGLDIPIEAKNLFINNLSGRKEEIDLSGMDGFEGFEEYDYAQNNPGKYAVSKAVASDLNEYKRYSSELGAIESDKDENGKTVSGSRKEKVVKYINDLDLDYGQKIILYRSQYKSDNTYNYEIVDYLNDREDISYETMVAILEELGFKVDGNTVTWD